MKRFLCLAMLLFPAGSFADKKQDMLVELQRDIATLQEQVRTMQRSLDEKVSALTVITQQTLDSANRANTSVAVLQGGLTDRVNEQLKTVGAPVAGLSSKLDSMADELRGVKESLTDVTSRMQKLDAKIVDLGNRIDISKTPLAPPPTSGTMLPGNTGSSMPITSTTTSTAPPSGMQAQNLYNNAMRDKSGGNLDLAAQEFTDYLRFYGTSALAPNAQFQLGDIYYQRNDLENAVKAFDAVLERYPANNKTPDAQLMKGLSLLKAGQRTAAGKEFRDVVDRYPGTEAATKAKSQLSALGYYVPGKPAPVKNRRR